MVVGIISKVLGNKANVVSTDEGGPLFKDVFAAAFWVIEDWQGGLGERAFSYVSTGDDPTVLMDIESLRQLSQQRRYRFNEIYHERLQNEDAAQRLLMGAMGGQPERLARLAEIHLAIKGPATLHRTFSAKTVFDAPEVVKRLIVEVEQVYEDRRDESGTDTPTGATDVIAAVEILGGRTSDLLVFDLGKRYSNRLIIKNGILIGDVVLSETVIEEIVHAFHAMDAVTRATALETFASHERALDPAMQDFLFEQLGIASANVRKQARLILLKHPVESIESRVIEALSAGKTNLRTEAIILAGEIGSEACKAALRERLAVEKSTSVLAVLEQYLDVGPEGAGKVAAPEGTYLAASGRSVEIPELVSLADDTSPALDGEDARALARDREAYNTEHQRLYKERLSVARKRGDDHSWIREPVAVSDEHDAIFGWISTGIDEHGTLDEDGAVNLRYLRTYFDSWLSQRIDKLPLKRQVQIAVFSSRNLEAILYDYRSLVVDKVVERMEAGDFDLRHVIDEASARNQQFIQGLGGNRSYIPVTSLSLVEMLLESPKPLALPDAALWPVLAEHIPLLVGALPPKTSSAKRNSQALQLLASFPELPASAVLSVIFCAISEGPGLRDRAQEMLKGIDEIDKHLITVLDDKRQALRTNAARLLADRGCAEAVKPIEKRLKKERSENARVEMISALARLGADTSPYLGRKALFAEAEKLAAKLPEGGLECLAQAQIPMLRWKGGDILPDTVIDAWLKLALKLKQPGGSPLFELYLDQLEPDDVTAFADWLLATWIAYDTDRDDGSALRGQARKVASYPNSASDSKGILALTHRATPADMVHRIQSYLKHHGKRVSQTRTLVEVLAASGTPEALQVLVATATRFKQRTVRELAEQLLGEIATQRGWSEDELADRTVPSGGFQEDGTLELDVGEAAVCYTARLGDDLKVKLFNPEGRTVKALPVGKDENSKESRALLSAARKTVKTVTAQQTERLFGAMVAERHWEIEHWLGNIRTHPILRRLTERLIWLGFNTDKQIVASFRPTPEGDFLSAAGDDVDLEPVAYVGIAHASLVDEEARQAWLSHVADFQVTTLFAQIDRPMAILSEAQQSETALSDRKGWLMDSLTLRSASAKAGFERGPVGDGAGFSTYVKPFRSAGITAVLNFSGSYVPEDNIPAAIIDLHFVKGDGAYGKKIKLGDVPAILLSECWADLHQIAESGAYDSEWKTKGLY